MNDERDHEVVLVVFVLDELVQCTGGAHGQHRAWLILGRRVLIGVQLAVELQLLGTSEFDDDGQMMRLEDGL